MSSEAINGITMIAFGEVVRARVVAVAVGELLLDYGGEPIFVTLPELSWVPRHVDVENQFAVGSEIAARILRYDPGRQCYIGSLKRTDPSEDNPYVQYARNGIAAEYTAVVTALDLFHPPDCGRLELADGVRGIFDATRHRKTIQIGDSVRVYAREVDFERGYVEFVIVTDEEQRTPATTKALQQFPHW